MNKKDEDYLNDVFEDNPVGKKRVMGMIERSSDDLVTSLVIGVSFIVLCIGFGIIIGRSL